MTDHLQLSTSIIEAHDLTKVYQMGETQVHALRGVSLEVNAGEMLAIIGPSGSGKSTLMSILGALDKPTSGTYKLDGYEVSRIRDADLAVIRNWRIGFVFQKFNLMPRSTALANVALPLVYAGLSAAERTQRARTALEMVDLGSFTHHKPTELSGGQQQRVAIARALVNEPAIILADEPTGNLDTRTGDELMGLFHRLHEQNGITLLIVTHDMEVSAQAERVITIRDGLIVDDQRQEKQKGALHEQPAVAATGT
jgi:putative ABC transport system ATP-binding protein